MKTWFLILSLPLATACNNAGDAPGAKNDTSAVSTDRAGTDRKSGTCGKLIFFRRGAEIEARSYDGGGRVISTQTTKVLKVHTTDGMTVAEVEGTDVITGGETKVMQYNYKCDGKNIYFDIASMFRTDKKYQDASFESSLIAYPISVTEGESLPDATGSMTSERDGKKMEMKFHYKNRKVGGMEKITTPAGTWNCYKITNTVEVDMDFPGLDEASKKMMEAIKAKTKTVAFTWLAPDFGIVKSEVYSNDKLAHRNEVTAIVNSGL